MNAYDIGLDRNALDPLNIILDNIDNNSVVLEFGCANGRMTKYLKEECGCKVYIVEYSKELFDKAIKYAEDGICGDIMEFKWIDKFEALKFDYIIFADVLEHLSNPQEVLRRTNEILKDDGEVWLSVPNIAHNDIILNLCEGKFEYTDTGLLDNTHIHFFARNTFDTFFKNAEYECVFVDCINKQTNMTEQRIKSEIVIDDMIRMLDKRLDGEIYQYVFGIKKEKYCRDNNVKKVNNIKNDTRVVERRVFLSNNNEFTSDNLKIYYSRRKEKKFAIEIEWTKEVKNLRFDPVENIPCIIRNFEVYIDGEKNNISVMNGEDNNGDFIFKNLDPQICVFDIPENTKKVLLLGDIEYDYELIHESFEYKYKIALREQKLEREKMELTINSHISEKQNIKVSYMAECERLKRIIDNQVAREEDYKKKIKEKDDIIQQKCSYIEEKHHELDDLNSKYNHILNTKTWRYSKWLRTLIRVLKDSIKGKCKPKKINTTDVVEENLLNQSEYIDNSSIQADKKEVLFEDLCWLGEEEIIEEMPLVSVIVPNYNHAIYLRERLDSIYAQTYYNYEVILLDDCSNDGSREILKEYEEKYPLNTRTVFNTENCGKVFKQWNKGIELARGKYIWIAESDDYCENNFLDAMIPLFRKESVKLAFARSVFMTNGVETWNTEQYLSDISNMKWDRPFTMAAATIVDEAFSIKNIIPNVSSVVFRNVGKLSDEVQEIWQNMMLSGDWIFYLSMIRGGCISYTNLTTNYYRIHEKSTSLKVQHSMDYYKEYEEVSKFVAKNYKVRESNYSIILENLKEHYRAIQKRSDVEKVEKYYKIDHILAEKREPNVLMVDYSLNSGGGETYPLYLANEMYRQGLAVTLINYNKELTNPEIKKLLDIRVPIVNFESQDYEARILEQLKCEIIHTHHASADESTATWIKNAKLDCKHIITLHGMYETVDKKDIEHLLEITSETCSAYIYIADKNLTPFEKYGFLDKVKMHKLPNGLPDIPVATIKRKELGIEENAFVLCLVSRGIAEKGWREAIEAVKMAHEEVERPLHLIIVGDGEIRKELETTAPRYVHFMGIRNNVRDYFAMSDMGLLPSRFKGESFPLVVIEALMCGKPMLATDIAEVKNQLMDEQGNLAGELLTLKDWRLDENEIKEKIVQIVNDPDKYEVYRSRTESAKKKFDISKIAKMYLDIYKEALE